IQEGTYRPLGARQIVRSNVRIIAASNADLVGRANAGAFRWDLLFRLRILTLELPPLRARSADVPLLAQHFMRRFAGQYGQPVRSVDEQSLVILSRHTWPGNVRELENLIHRELLLSDAAVVRIRPECLIQAAPQPAPERDGDLAEATFDLG